MAMLWLFYDIQMVHLVCTFYNLEGCIAVLVVAVVYYHSEELPYATACFYLTLSEFIDPPTYSKLTICLPSSLTAIYSSFQKEKHVLNQDYAAAENLLIWCVCCIFYSSGTSVFECQCSTETRATG